MKGEEAYEFRVGSRTVLRLTVLVLAGALFPPLLRPHPQGAAPFAGNDFLAKIVRYGGATEEIVDLEGKLHEAEKKNGSASSEVLPYLYRLLKLYKERGYSEEAAELAHRSLSIEQSTNGTDVSPGQLRSLASLSIDMGDLGRAELYYLQLVEWAEKVTDRGKVRDPATLTIALTELADHLTREKKFSEAESIYTRVIELDSRAYGADHSLALEAIRKLAYFYEAKESYGEAEAQYRRILSAAENPRVRQAAGFTAVSDALGQIPRLYVKQGRFAEAEKIYRGAVGAGFIASANLAAALAAQGKMEEAEGFRKIALERWASNAEMNYAPAVTALNELAQAYHLQGNDAKAEEVYRFVLDTWDQKALWPAAYGRIFLREQYTRLLRGQGREADAGAVELKDAQTYWRKWMVVYNRVNAVGEIEVATHHVLEGIREAVRGFGADHANVAEGLERYAELLRKRNRPAAAQEVEARAKLIRSKNPSK